MPSREYAKRMEAQREADVAAGKDPDDFRRDENGEVLYGISVEGIIEVPQSKVDEVMAFYRDRGLDVENHGRINPSGVPEDLD